jgi:hypothetical protein
MKHPLAETFDLAEGDTFNSDPLEGTDLTNIDRDPYAAVPASAVAKPYEDDAEDKEINGKIDEIYGAAMEAYQNQTAFVEILEPRYAARNAEVAANYLNTALNAVSLKAKVKNEKRKVGQAGFIPYANQTTNNVVVADRNQLLRMMAEGKGPIVNGE